MIFIYCNWVCTRWQWSVNVYKNIIETDIYKGETINKIIQKHRLQKTGNKHKKQTLKRTLKHKSRVIKK